MRCCCVFCWRVCFNFFGHLRFTGWVRIAEDMSVAERMEAQNAAAFQQFNDKAMAACPNCARTFLPDRLTIHLRSCRPGNAAKRVGDVGYGGAGAPMHPKRAAQVTTTSAAISGTARPHTSAGGARGRSSLGGGDGGGMARGAMTMSEGLGAPPDDEPFEAVRPSTSAGGARARRNPRRRPTERAAAPAAASAAAAAVRDEEGTGAGSPLTSSSHQQHRRARRSSRWVVNAGQSHWWGGGVFLTAVWMWCFFLSSFLLSSFLNFKPVNKRETAPRWGNWSPVSPTWSG